MAIHSPNFNFLADQNTTLLRIAARAERYAFSDPNTALFKIRQLAQLIAREAATLSGIRPLHKERFVDTLDRLEDHGVIDRQLATLFHGLRDVGNDAAHTPRGSLREALHQLKMVRQIAIWYHRAFGQPKGFKPGPFVPPPDPAAAERALKDELAVLRRVLADHQQTSLQASQTAAEATHRVSAAEEDARKAYAELEAAMELAQESTEQLEQEREAFEARLQALQAQINAQPKATTLATVRTAQAASRQVVLTEAETRELIDRQLIAAGWTADSVALRHSRGARPARGKNQAIAEWPMPGGRADYVLFIGLNPVAVVEAKKATLDVSGTLEQAKRYSQDFDGQSEGGPWGKYRIPFVFSTNGRPYLKQLQTKSGIWFRDLRKTTNASRALMAWKTPAGLTALLKQDNDRAHQALQAERTDYLGLRPYQLRAVSAIETALQSTDRQTLLVQMATGTGKTRTSIALAYRLLKTQRFHRILFLVDRQALGKQATESYMTTRLEGNQTFYEIFNLASDFVKLGDTNRTDAVRVQFSTVQGMLQRIFRGDRPPAIDDFDCIIVDESHRGYHLDRELSETELQFRDQGDYISKYRRVLEYFDAVKIVGIVKR